MRRGLFLKYVTAFVGLVTLVLVINAALDLTFSYRDNRRASIEVQHEKAEAAAQKVEAFVREIERQIGWVAYPQWRSLPAEQRRFEYARLQRQAPAITELSQLDGRGHEQLKISRLTLDAVGSDADRSAEPAFTEAVANRTYFGPVYYRQDSEPYLTMAVAHGGRNGGVTVAEINLKLILGVISQIKVGKEGYAYVVDAQGRLVAHPDLSLVLRGTDMNRLPQVAQARAPKAAPGPETPSHDLAGRGVLSAHAEIPALRWLVFVDLPDREVLQPVIDNGLRDLALLALSLAIAALAAALLARRMLVPIRAMQAGAQRIGGGELGYRMSVRTGDELESLADQFNRSAAALQESYATLEQRVVDRTGELNEALEQQTATADILRVISRSPTDVQPVLDAVARASLRFCGADDAVVLLRDGDGWRTAAHERARPVAGDSGATVTAPMVRDGTTVGRIVLRRAEPGAFTPRQIELLEAFAAQAVIALANVRLFAEVQELNKGLEAKVQAQVGELERVGRLKRFLAPQLAQAIISAGDEKILQNHRREVAAFFCDLRGFTPFSETAEPEDIMALLAEYHGAVGPLIRKYEGTLDRFTGDGMLVFFNDPVPCPDPAVRAGKLALEMRAAVARLMPVWRRRGHALGFGIGMAQGFATLGRIGFEDRFDYTAIGAVINLAARLCADAKDGQILASGRLCAALEGVIELEDLGERAVRGMSKPIAVSNLVRLKT